jgi:hypothetical protein
MSPQAARLRAAEGRKFRFRAGFLAWQYRNAGLISSTYPHAKAENHAIVTLSGRLPISEFLIVGCQHGWLYGISWDRGILASRDSHGE